ncbi:hypothetical protein ROLI_029780 [Roseobacter fucihabitans]|uniref:HTH marR-type domain-containing protein n=1 Tax=Roseobacter fucihabitans TaxID=1537242 RepID=A0ABZ2BWY4_9RHOB|nr:MarR family winged helix-turn-helix transcriptional regulator [Roseobacter litoralis]MBC6967233.1 MarR family protein [Roseobacter litoralis]
MNEDQKTASKIFDFFTEVGIITQLSTAMFAKSLPDGVHPSHFSILNHLARLGDGRPPARIAAAMQVTKNTMSHSLKVLSARDFITVAADPDDGRGKLVFLTPTGRRFRDRAITDVTETFGPVFGPQQLEIMDRIQDDLAQMRKHLDDNR